MAARNDFKAQQMHPVPFRTRIIHGTGLATVLIIVALITLDEPRQEGIAWIILPLILVPVAGALGGTFSYMMDFMRNIGGWKKFAANIISALVYTLLVMTGFVLSMDGLN